MSFPVYTLEAVRTPPFHYGDDDDIAPPPRSRRARNRDPQTPKSKRVCIPAMRVPIYKVVLRKEGVLRVPRLRIDMPAQAHEVAYALIGDRPYEHLVAIFLNAINDITGAIIIATSGSVSTAPVTARGVFTGALVHNAVGIILAHNHPSGNPEPSADDIKATATLREAAAVLGIPILDHLIITRDPDRWQSITCPR